jgi:hypothetical protein
LRGEIALSNTITCFPRSFEESVGKSSLGIFVFSNDSNNNIELTSYWLTKSPVSDLLGSDYGSFEWTDINVTDFISESTKQQNVIGISYLH